MLTQAPLGPPCCPQGRAEKLRAQGTTAVLGADTREVTAGHPGDYRPGPQAGQRLGAFWKPGLMSRCLVLDVCWSDLSPPTVQFPRRQAHPCTHRTSPCPSGLAPAEAGGGEHLWESRSVGLGWRQAGTGPVLCWHQVCKLAASALRPALLPRPQPAHPLALGGRAGAAEQGCLRACPPSPSPPSTPATTHQGGPA